MEGLTDVVKKDLHHEVILRLLNHKLQLAPLKNPQRILDIGTVCSPDVIAVM